VGFQHEGDARRFLADLRERFARFGLDLHEGKTRLIEFGRHATRRRKARGLARPETFDLLGFTHICGKARDGRFGLRRVTIAKRMRAKSHQVRDELWRRRHLPVPVQGAWLGSVVRGHCAYYAVPGNSDAIREFRTQAARHWYRWLPKAKITHPWPSVRFDARTQGRSPVR
jgi:RNA-directed DNA polymerase